MRPKRTLFEDMQNGAGKKIARAFFLTFVTPTEVTKKEYPNAYYMRNIKKRGSLVITQVSKRFGLWAKEGFLIESKHKIPVMVEKKKGKEYKLEFPGYMLNLEPIFKYCKEKGVDFTEDETRFINELLEPIQIRKKILEENPDKDIITATLTFYAQHYPLYYSLTLTEIRDFGDKYRKELNELKSLQNRSSETKRNVQNLIKSFSGRKRDESKLDIFDIIRRSHPSLKENNFNRYHESRKLIRNLVLSVDHKVLKVLGLYPIDILKYKLSKTINQRQLVKNPLK